MSITQPIQPIQQPAIADIRNALQALIAWREESLRGDLRDVERLLRHALEGLGEPNAAAIQAADAMLKTYDRNTVDAASGRSARDTAAVILNAQLRGTL